MCLPKKDHATRRPAGAEATNALSIGERAARAAYMAKLGLALRCSV